ncbi:MAG: HAD family phosphatase [Bacteroidota bacterium]
MTSLPSRNQIDAIIFDFGGVLFDIDYNAPVEAFKKLNLANFQEWYAKAGQSKLFDELEVGNIKGDEFLEELAQLSTTPVEKHQIKSAWNAILKGISKDRIQLIHDLSNSHRTFLLSNTNALHVEAFEKVLEEVMGMEFYRTAFEHIHYSNVLGMRKPHPETFLHVCSLHDLEPARTLFIDDSKQHVDGALKAGLIAYHLELSEEDIHQAFKNW